MVCGGARVETDHGTITIVVKETKRPGLLGRPHCKGVAIGVDTTIFPVWNAKLVYEDYCSF